MLPTGEVVAVKVDEFLNYAPVVGFTDNLKKLVTKAALRIAGDATRIVFVATGGGAKLLPIIRKIAEQGIEGNDFEATIDSARAFLYAACVMLLVRRIVLRLAAPRRPAITYHREGDLGLTRRLSN